MTIWLLRHNECVIERTDDSAVLVFPETPGHIEIDGKKYGIDKVPKVTEVGRLRGAFVADDGRRWMILGLGIGINKEPVSMIDWPEFAMVQRRRADELEEQVEMLWDKIREIESKDRYDDFGGIFKEEE